LLESGNMRYLRLVLESRLLWHGSLVRSVDGKMRGSDHLVKMLMWDGSWLWMLTMMMRMMLIGMIRMTKGCWGSYVTVLRRQTGEIACIQLLWDREKIIFLITVFQYNSIKN